MHGMQNTKSHGQSEHSSYKIQKVNVQFDSPYGLKRSLQEWKGHCSNKKVTAGMKRSLQDRTQEHKHEAQSYHEAQEDGLQMHRQRSTMHDFTSFLT